MGPQAVSFFQKTKDARRVLVMDLGFLGDAIHIFPALWEIRKAFPEAKLDIIVAEHVKGLLKVLPWVDEVLGYPRFPKGPKWYEDLERVWKLRRRGYDVVINLNGSDRSSILTACTGAKNRLGRVPPKPSAFWPYCFTDTVEYPRGALPVYKQAWECLKKTGFPVGEQPEFNIEIPKEDRQSSQERLGLDGELGMDYIHVSPFTTLDMKELPIPMMSVFFNRIKEADPELKIVFSCAPNDRERGKLITLLAALDFEPWRVFSGNLSLLELAAVIEGSRLHVGGDSGALHVALMTGAKTLSWFRDYDNKEEWLPDGEGHAHVMGQASDAGLQGIEIEDLEEAWERLGQARKTVFNLL